MNQLSLRKRRPREVLRAGLIFQWNKALTGSRAVLVVCLMSMSILGCASTESVRSAPADTMQAWELAALQAYHQGDFVSAESYLNQLVKREPKRVRAWFLLGQIHLRHQRLPAAERAFLQVVKLEPDLQEAWHNLAVTQLRTATATLIEARQHGDILQPAFLEWLFQVQGQLDATW
ncbi:tetratricopeptide repeat protein [Aliidiomarina sanyensis]|nr:tetratricopeptide repeat protein [Aliidiomarina sanyensis]